MPGKGGRRLVIDADVARSAGETEYAVSSACRQFLDAVTEYRHRVVITPELQNEWREHASRYPNRWLRRMYARRLVHRCTVAGNDPTSAATSPCCPPCSTITTSTTSCTSASTASSPLAGPPCRTKPPFASRVRSQDAWSIFSIVLE